MPTAALPTYSTEGYWQALNALNSATITELETENRELRQALTALLDDLAQLEGSGPFVISREFCEVNRERARELLAL